MKAQIGVSRFDIVPEEIVAEFVDSLPPDHFDVKTGTHGAIFAGVEWLMPAAIALFFVRAYFDSIFSEMGKDHYNLLKRGTLALYRRASALKLTRMGTAGKLSSDERYSMAFAVSVAVNESFVVKMLIQPALSETDAERAMNAFFELIESTSESTSAADVLEQLGRVRIIGKTILVAYDFQRSTLVAVDPIDRPS